MSKSVERVRAALEAAGLGSEIRRMGESTRTAEEAARQVGCTPAEIVKSLVFRGEESRELFLFLVSGASRLDAAKAAAVAGEALSRADPDDVRARTGFAIGGIPPIGHDSGMKVFADWTLLGFPLVWAAAGAHDAVFSARPDMLLDAARAVPADIT